MKIPKHNVSDRFVPLRERASSKLKIHKCACAKDLPISFVIMLQCANEKKSSVSH